MAVSAQPSWVDSTATITMDMDIDLGPEPDFEPEIEHVQTIVRVGTDPLAEEATFEKVHIRGVDELTTDDIKQFATSHFQQEVPSRVEWIDDTSANLIYSSADIGLQALAALTQVNEEDASSLPPLRLRSAKSLSTHPDYVLQVRSAIKTDRKQARAYDKSRFYLMHPEHDPRERLRQELSDRRRSGTGSNEGDYRRRRFDDNELRRRRDRDYDENLSANMYDDPPERGQGERKDRGPRELFPTEETSAGRLRNRSASPGRDTLDDKYRVDPGDDSRRRFRERSPARRRNEGKELFSTKPDDGSVRELFPNKTTSSYLKKELFPSKVSNHRRSDAIDDDRRDVLARRITAAPVELFPDNKPQGDQGAAMRGGNGISIKGRSSSVRELFPAKFNNANAGKELFSDKLVGRGGRRRKAEDMFS
ncbi:hypothetical protein N7495_004984 [Penicillium taxi]|uniref:uncharacterized protein n=1 Tax=Penicillium taxi TaxID=168475 RepID=UPI002544E624|nr:uncharacterized protein N7495_004984 [Penicillium taxi]KAJ5893293.1 hypothetical protein N7495_004984 [Penicillium taxi]